MDGMIAVKDGEWWIFKPGKLNKQGLVLSNLTYFLYIADYSSKSSSPASCSHDSNEPGPAHTVSVVLSADAEIEYSGDVSSLTCTSIDLDATSAINPSLDNDQSHSSNISIPSPKSQMTVHQKPSWLSDLKQNFSTEIIEECSAKTRAAVASNENIQDDSEFKRVKSEILNVLFSKLKTMYAGTGNPGAKVMRDLVITLRDYYPNMFRESNAEPGKRKIENVDRQAYLMCDRYREKRRREDARLQADNPRVNIEASGSKKGKPKQLYGVISEKFFKVKKPSGDALKIISKASDETEFQKRESIYSKYREEMQHEFREAAKNDCKISQIVRGFFLDKFHLAYHFEYLTGVPSLFKNVEKNLASEVAKMELFVKHEDQSLDFVNKMREIEDRCAYEFNGSTIWRDLQVLVI